MVEADATSMLLHMHPPARHLKGTQSLRQPTATTACMCVSSVTFWNRWRNGSAIVNFQGISVCQWVAGKSGCFVHRQQNRQRLELSNGRKTVCAHTK